MKKLKKQIARAFIIVFGAILTIAIPTFVAPIVFKYMARSVIFDKFMVSPSSKIYYTGRLFNDSWIDRDERGSYYICNMYEDRKTSSYKIATDVIGTKHEHYKAPREISISYSLRGEFKNDARLVVSQDGINDDNLLPFVDTWQVKFIEQEKNCLTIYFINDSKEKYCDINPEQPFKIKQHVHISLIPF